MTNGPKIVIELPVNENPLIYLQRLQRKAEIADELADVLEMFMAADGHDDFEDVWPDARAILLKYKEL